MAPIPALATHDRPRFRNTLLTALVFLALCLCTAFADFSTKGEPREALVAVEMLRSGNWILPIDQNGDMAYKPPMFHWLVTLFSLPAGHVSEFTSRLPSAVALTMLLVMTFRFCARARDERFGLLCAGLMLTCFEVTRAGTVCRVDMVLTMFMAGAMMALYMARQSRRTYTYMTAAVLCMSAGALTKGPVAIVLPIGVAWTWRLLMGDRFMKVTGQSLAMTAAALVIPALWYWAAWKQGGDRFLTLAVEENFGRFLGHMSYDSHVKPLWYNFVSLLTGLLPWSVAVLATAFIPRMRGSLDALKRWRHTWEAMSPAARFALVAAIVVFVFYCIPKSKRSVYLLPMYPFIAFGLGCYAQCLVRHGVTTVTSTRRVLGIVGCLMALGFAVAFPIFSKTDSDKAKAAQIASVTPSGPVYSFLPDRFIRFYITDFYLGGRIVSLLPSGQVGGASRTSGAAQITMPNRKPFHMLTTADIYDGDREHDHGLHAWLTDNGLEAEELYRSASRGHDVKGFFVLLLIKDKCTRQP